MDEEIKKLLKRNIEISQETLSYVRSINRQFIWQRFFRIIKWGLIIGLLVFGFIQLQPYVDSFAGILDNLKNTFSGVSNILPETNRQ
ncbi:MAG: hypothetical protein AAB930_03965 [Patescibacteria group bacterium]